MKQRGNILITAVGGDIGQSVVQCLLGSEYSGRLYGCDIDPYAAGQVGLQGFTVAPKVSAREAYRSFMLKTAEKSGIKYILPINEREIVYFAQAKKYYESKGITVLVHERNIVDTFMDKYLTIRFLKNKGISVPETYLLKDYKGEFNFPLILKERHSCGGKGMHEIRGQKEFDLYAGQGGKKDLMVQESIGTIDNEYTVGVFRNNSEVYSIAFRRELGYGSMTKTAVLHSDKELNALAENIAEAIGFTGSVNIQLRKAGGEYIPFEINPRLSSTVFFRYQCGFKDVKWWLDIVQGKEVIYRPARKTGVGVRTVGAVFFDVKK